MVEISLDLARSRRILAVFQNFLDRFLPFSSFLGRIIIVFQIFNPDQSTRHPLKLRPTQSDQPLWSQQVKILTTQSSQVNSELGINPTRTNPWTSLNLAMILEYKNYLKAYDLFISRYQMNHGLINGALLSLI